jgi:hypothetical protein
MKESLVLSVLALAACSQADPPANPSKLWLALAGSELMVQLVPVEPDPF